MLPLPFHRSASSSSRASSARADFLQVGPGPGPAQSAGSGADGEGAAVGVDSGAGAPSNHGTLSVHGSALSRRARSGLSVDTFTSSSHSGSARSSRRASLHSGGAAAGVGSLYSGSKGGKADSSRGDSGKDVGSKAEGEEFSSHHSFNRLATPSGSAMVSRSSNEDSSMRRSVRSSNSGGTNGRRVADEAGQAEQAGERLQLPPMCSCGSVFWEEDVYCRKCGVKRSLAKDLPAVCVCGEEFTEDSRFCHKCGRKRKMLSRNSSRSSRLFFSSRRGMQRSSFLEPRRAQMQALAQEMDDIEVASRPSEWTVCGILCFVVRFVVTCHWIGGCKWLWRVASHKDFIQTPIANSICGCVIMLNAALIGFEMELNTGDQSSRIAWFVVESIFLVFFIAELLLRFRCLGLKGFKDLVMLFDTLLVLLGVADTWIAGAIMVSQSDAAGDALFKVTLFRLVRLARMVRVLRVIKLFRYFRELVLLVRGIIGAIQGLNWSMVLITMLLYLCSVLTTTVYVAMTGGSSPSTAIEKDMADWFGSIGSSCLTLFQVMTLEEWYVVVRTSNKVWSFSWMFFVPFLLIANLALLNAVTAVVVENVWSIAQSEASDEAKRSEKLRARALVKFKQLFQTIDVDSNAHLDQEEFKKALNNPHVMQQLNDLGIARCEADELFELCDVDGNRVLSVAEFVDGCLRVIGPGKSKHLLQVQHDVLRAFRSLQGQVHGLEKNLKVVVKILSKVNGHKRPKRRQWKAATRPQFSGRPTQLKISIIGATSLHRPAGASGVPSAPDAYCICEVPRSSGEMIKFQTWAVTSDANPVWDHEEEVGDYASGEAIVFSIFSDGGCGQGELLGRAALPGCMVRSDGFVGELELKEAPAGERPLLSIRVEPVGPQPPNDQPATLRVVEAESEVSPRPPNGRPAAVQVPEAERGVGLQPPKGQPEGPWAAEAGSELGPVQPKGAPATLQMMEAESEVGLQPPSDEPAALSAAEAENEVSRLPSRERTRPKPLTLEGTDSENLSLSEMSPFRYTLPTFETPSLLASSPPAPLPSTPEDATEKPSPPPAQPQSGRNSRLAPPTSPLAFLVGDPGSSAEAPEPAEPVVPKLAVPESGWQLGGLLDASRQEQRELNQLLEGLLEEAHLLHGHVSEVASLNWDKNQTPSRQRCSLNPRLSLT